MWLIRVPGASSYSDINNETSLPQFNNLTITLQVLEQLKNCFTDSKHLDCCTN